MSSKELTDEVAIKVEGLGKRYRLGRTKEQRYSTLRDSITHRVASMLEGIRSWRSFRAKSPRLRRRQEEEWFWALRDVGFEVRRGEVIGIIGRNGAGKSTLLKILSRIIEPTEGRVVIHGRVGSLLEVGTGFHPELTGRENIYLNGAILGMKKAEIERKFDEIVAFAEIEKFIDTPVKRYSSGMYVRLAFAVAAHLEPEILLVDEVLAVGDAAFQKKCLGKMGDVAKEGRTVLFVSHNMSAVQHLCERGLVLENGKLVFSGAGSEAVEKYLNSASTQNYGFVDLCEHPGRQRGMLPIIKFLGLLSKDGIGYRDTIKTGEDVVFEIECECGDISIDYAVIGICSYLGERVCTVGTHLSPGFDKTLRGKGVLKCFLPHLPLAEGEYSVLVALGTRIPRRNVDCVENALRFRVESGNFFGTGATLLRSQGYLAQQSHWYVDSYSD
ncbi:MAG: ABC transporter ATP-binding protein [bacterium]